MGLTKPGHHDRAGRTRQISPSQSARDRALHLAQNPFLDLDQMPLAFNSAIGIEGLASLAIRTTHRSLVLQPSQVSHSPDCVEWSGSMKYVFPRRLALLNCPLYCMHWTTQKLQARSVSES